MGLRESGLGSERRCGLRKRSYFLIYCPEGGFLVVGQMLLSTKLILQNVSAFENDHRMTGHLEGHFSLVKMHLSCHHIFMGEIILTDKMNLTDDYETKLL